MTGTLFSSEPGRRAVGAGMLVGLGAHHYLSRLGTSLQAEHRRGEKLDLVSDVSGTLTGPLPPADIAIKFLEKVRKVVPGARRRPSSCTRRRPRC